MPAATLDQALAEIGATGTIDFVSVDVEGLELEVLNGFSLDRHCPRLLIIEDNTLGADNSVVSYLKSKRYFRVHRTGVNDWFVRVEDVSRFLGRRIALKIRMSKWRMIRAIRQALGHVIVKKTVNSSPSSSSS